MSARRKLAFVLVVAGAVVLAGGYTAWAALAGGDGGPSDATVRPVSLGSTRVVVYRSLDRVQREQYGRIAVARGAAREQVGLECERVYFAGGRGLCLARSGRLGFTYRAKVLGPDFRPVRDVKLTGIPSRARVSRDGRYGASTTFVSGHSYQQQGTFSTRTVIYDLAAGRELLELEQLEVRRDGKVVDAPDVNFWGVTFAANPNRFYATLATGGKTYLIEGDVRARRARVLRENVECPSLSPDGTRVAYKKRVQLVAGSPTVWQLHVLDLRTMRDTPLAETRPIDDQAEWLDDEQVLYGVGEEVWAARADGTGTPRRFLRAAASPAVVNR